MTEKERYATIGTWVEILREEGIISMATLRNRLKIAGIVGRDGRFHSGHPALKAFYAESDVRALVSDLLGNLPCADADGTFEIDGEIYGTVVSLARALNISAPVIVTRLNKSTFKPTRGKDSLGHPCVFFPLSKVRELCTDLLEDIPQAGPDGTFEKEGVVYGTASSLAKILNLSVSPIASKIKRTSLAPIRGKDQGGRVRDFFSLPKVRELCSDLLQDLPRAGQDGTFEINGEIYRTVGSLSKLLKLSKEVIVRKVQTDALEPVRGKMRGGQVQNFYPLSRIRELCADFLEDLPWAGTDGTFEKNGEIYGTVGSLSRALQLSDSTISIRLNLSPAKPTRGKDSMGHVCTFYPLSKVRERCLDFIKAYQADEDGLLEIDGETYGTMNALARILGISETGIALRLKKSSLQGVLGRCQNGVWDLYPLSKIRELCFDLVEDLPRAGEDGTFEKEGVVYGTVVSLSRVLKISAPTILSKVESATLEPVRGKGQRGGVFDFYSLPKVRELCADLIAKRQKSDD